MRFHGFQYKLQVEGIMPERALLRLKRAGISLYKVQKVEKNRLLFLVKKKDMEKVFAIYPSLCYNIRKRGEQKSSLEEVRTYRMTLLGGVGLTRGLEFCKRRGGLILGGLLFCALTLSADGLVLGVRTTGNTAYTREVLATLEEGGMKPFAYYPEGREDVVTAKLLTLKGVEFCSVKRVGHWVEVDIRTSPFQKSLLQRESMLSPRTGELVSITVLRGTALKEIGGLVQAGEPIVGNWFDEEEEGQVFVEPIARVQIACAHEGVYADVKSEEEAFAKAYLACELSGIEDLQEKSVTRVEGGFLVKIRYLVTESVNM